MNKNEDIDCIYKMYKLCPIWRKVKMFDKNVCVCNDLLGVCVCGSQCDIKRRGKKF